MSWPACKLIMLCEMLPYINMSGAVNESGMHTALQRSLPHTEVALIWRPQENR